MQRRKMESNKLYFIKDEYFSKFNISTYSTNKVEDENGEHNRPCYYAFKDGKVIWMIPLSSQVAKYQKEYNKSIEKYGMCDGISIIYVKGNKNAALIQNMFPVTEKYIDKIYTFKGTTTPIEINQKTQKELNAKARKVVRMARIGKKLTFTPILEVERKLLEENTLVSDPNMVNIAST